MSDDINNGTARKREEWIDMLSGFGMLLVIIGHSRCPDVLAKFIYGFHMPLLFMLLWNRFKKKTAECCKI